MRHAHLHGPRPSSSSSSAACSYSQKQILCSDTLEADPTAFAYFLRSCSNSKDISHGRLLHHCIVTSAFEHELPLQTLLVQVYVKCASLEDAEASFLHTHERNLGSWNCLIGAYADDSEGREGFKLFQQMQQEAVMADCVTHLGMLSICTTKGDLIAGRQIHAQIICIVSERDIVIATALVNMYGKAGSMVDAQKIFSNMSTRNVVTWSCMIALCTRYGMQKEAFQLFDGMLQGGVLPNTFTFVSILSACASPTFAQTGKFYHARLVGTDLEQHPYMGNALTNMYGRCGFLKEAESSFDTMCKQGAYSWNIILAAHAHHGKIMDAMKVLDKMLEEKVLPDITTFVNLLSACANQMALAEGMEVHITITLLGLDQDTEVSNSLLNMYGKCNSLDVAQKLLKEMSEPDVVSWNTLISSYAQQNLGREAVQAYLGMIQEGICPNQVTYTCILDALACEEVLGEGRQIHASVASQLNVVVMTALVNMYGKCSSLPEALRVFHHRTVQNVLLWNAVFSACNQNEQGDEALNLFTRMLEEDVLADNFTLSNVLSSCASQAAVTKGMTIHALAIEYGFAQDTVVGTALVNMYGKCGGLADAMGVFNSIHRRDVVLWTAIIQASSQHGHGKEAIRLLSRMEAVAVPNKITFLSALSACSHSGLLNEGRRCFTSMQEDYGIVPAEEHYDCMVDLLARSGLLEEAEKLMRAMPFQASYVLWTTLLGACRNEHDVERGERIGKHLIDLYPERASPYIVLSQIYTEAGREDDAEAVMNQMKSRAIQKQVGYSVIEVNGTVHKFETEEQSHSDRIEIYAEIEKIDGLLKKAGYEPAGPWFVTEEGRSDEPCVHSEKLAAAFGVLSTAKGTPLLVTKNLRICLDCHSYLKAFSKVSQRQITVRDAHRFHRLVNGTCSCGDYW